MGNTSNAAASLAPGSGGLDQSLVRGLAWTGAVKWSSQVLSWVSTILVARMLSPEDYGLVAMAGVILGFITLFNEFGLGSAVVALRHLTEDHIREIHGLACLLGVGGFLLACVASLPTAGFFRSSELTGIIIVSAVGFIFAAVRSIPSAVCEKQLRFKLLALLEGGQSLVAAAGTIGLAWFGAGYWALVLGGLAGNLAATSVLTYARPLPVRWPSMAAVKQVIDFSSHILVGRIAWFIASSADVFIGGRVLGQAMVGTYSFATTIANVPLEKVTALASRVMPAFYASVRNSPEALRRYFLLLTEGVALITFPVGIGMVLVGPDFVSLFLGEKWQGVVLPLQILAGWASVRSIVGLQNHLLYMTGHSKLAMLNTVNCALTYPVAFFIGSQYGVVGLSLAWVVVQPLTWVTPYRRAFEVTGLSLHGYLSSLQAPVAGVVVMVGSVVTVHYLLLDLSCPMPYRFVIDVGVGAASYGGVLIGVYKSRLQSLVQMWKNART